MKRNITEGIEILKISADELKYRINEENLEFQRLENTLSDKKAEILKLMAKQTQVRNSLMKLQDINETSEGLERKD